MGFGGEKQNHTPLSKWTQMQARNIFKSSALLVKASGPPHAHPYPNPPPQGNRVRARRKTEKKRKYLCLYCGLAGHWATDCPFKKDSRLNFASISGNSVPISPASSAPVSFAPVSSTPASSAPLYANPGAAFFHEGKNSASL